MAHGQTQWQITLATDPTFAAPVVDVTTDHFLELIPVLLGLMVSTNYICRTKYFDDSTPTPFESAWSPAVPFTTLPADLIPPPGQFNDTQYMTDAPSRFISGVSTILDIALASDFIQTSFPQGAAIQDFAYMTDVPTSVHFRRSDTRHILRTVVIDPVVILPPITTLAS